MHVWLLDKSEAEALLNHPKFSHTRQGDRLHRGTVKVYHFADTASGFLLQGCIADAVFEQCQRPRTASPLSPTESR
jgi:hypothetical protein